MQLAICIIVFKHVMTCSSQIVHPWHYGKFLLVTSWHADNDPVCGMSWKELYVCDFLFHGH